MNFEEKRKLLQAFGIPALMEEQERAESELLTLEKEELEFTSKNSDYLGGRGDCVEVKFRESELLLSAPESLNGKKLTVDERKAWLQLQRRSDLALKQALRKQEEVEFQLEDLRLRKEVLKRKTDRIRALLRVREAQIRFLAVE